MADRYLLESGTPDGYLLEDGSGVLILEGGAAGPVSDAGNVSTDSHVATPRLRGGFSLTANLLVTTLAVAAAGVVFRAPTVQTAKRAPAVQATQQHNLLLTTLGTPVAPVGAQATASAPRTFQTYSVGTLGTPRLLLSEAAATTDVPRVATLQNAKSAPAVSATQQHNLLTSTLSGVPIPIGKQSTQSAPATPRTLLWNKDTNVLLLPFPLPIGKQQIESAPPTSRIGSIRFARGLDPGAPVVEADPLPQGKQQVSSAPVGSRVNQIESLPNLLAGPLAPMQIGAAQSEFSFAITRPAVSSWVAPNLVIGLETVAADELPIGVQQIESAPPTTRIGSIRFARGLDPGAPVAGSDPLPQGKQQLASAPVGSRLNQIEAWPNLLAGPLAYATIASSQSEFMFSIRRPEVLLWTPRNVTINLPVGADPLPQGKQQTDSAPIRRASVWSDNLANVLLGLVNPRSRTISPTGNITFSGSAEEGRERQINPAGDIVFSGLSDRANINIVEPSGQITFTGTATMAFVPAGSVLITSRLPLTGAGIT